MTGEPLKAGAVLSRTINLGKFSSIRIELSEEFYVGSRSHLEVVAELDRKIQETVKLLRIAQAND